MLSSLGIGFALGWIGSMPVAGAVSIFVFQRGLAGRVRDGLLLSAGAALAEGAWCMVARSGARQVLGRWPAFGPVAEVVGGLLLIALGLYFVRLRNRLPASEPSFDGLPALREIGLGMALVAGNVAIPLNWLALVTVVYSLGFDPFAGPPGSFSAGVVLGIMGWFTTLVLVLDRFRGRFTDHNLSRLMRLMGGLLILVGAVALMRI